MADTAGDDAKRSRWRAFTRMDGLKATLLVRGWVPPSPDADPPAMASNPSTTSNDAIRERLLDNGWTPDRSEVVCCGAADGNQRCTYRAFMSFFTKYDGPFTRVHIPAEVPNALRGWYLWWKVGSFAGRFPKEHPL